MDLVQELVANLQFEQVANSLDRLELEAASPNPLEEWPHALHLLGHIYNKQLEDARFLWMRFPAAVKQNNPELQAVWALLQLLWNKKHRETWPVLKGTPWRAELLPLVDSLCSRIRQDSQDLISTAYSTISPAAVGQMLGVGEQEALEWCLSQGWILDPAAQTVMVTVVPRPQVVGQRDGYATLQHLTNYMTHLEH